MSNECLGIFWDGPPGGPCLELSCAIIQECLAKFASEKLVMHQRALGPAATPEQLADFASVSVEAIAVALQFQVNAGIDPTQPTPMEAAAAANTIPAVEPPLQSPPPPTGPANPPGDGGGGVQPPSAAGEPPVPPELVGIEAGPPAPPPDVPPAPKPKSGPCPTCGKPFKRLSRHKCKVVPKAPPTQEVESPANFPQASPASAAGLAKSEMKSVQPVKAVETRRGWVTWDPKYDRIRWERERQRSPAIAKLLPGMKLDRFWKQHNKLYTVIVRVGYYQFQDKRYPTLYSITKLIVGTKPARKQLKEDGTRPRGERELCTWSAARFWRLDRLTGQLKGSNKKGYRKPKGKRK